MKLGKMYIYNSWLLLSVDNIFGGNEKKKKTQPVYSVKENHKRLEAELLNPRAELPDSLRSQDWCSGDTSMVLVEILYLPN